MKKFFTLLALCLAIPTVLLATPVKKSTATVTKPVVVASTKPVSNPLIPSDKVVILNMEYDVRENPFTGEMYKPSSLCSGFFIGTKGQIMTAAHCVDDPDILNVKVKTIDGSTFTATVLYVSPTSDLALIKITTTTVHEPFKVAPSMAQGDEIYTLGHPLRKEYTLTRGIVAAMEEPEQKKTLVDMTMLPGNSGGAIYNKKGELVGVCSAGYIVGMGTTGLNLSVSLKQINDFLDLFRGL